MSVRPRSLPPGWYPTTADAVRRQIAVFLAGVAAGEVGATAPGAVAGIAPHAGWAFSGAIAAGVIAALDPEAETVVVVGGHLGRGDRAVAAREESYETPLGPLAADLELLAAIEAGASLGTDDEADNTVEVQLPLVQALLPRARVLGLRAPPRAESYELGQRIAGAAAAIGRAVVVVGSTDLTHYGPNYGFQPKGTGRRALQWVRDENDARIIRAMVAMDKAGVLAAATEGRAACSAGGAVAAMGFAAAAGSAAGVLLRYSTSHDAHPDDSFVGYAGVVYLRRAGSEPRQA
jgi:MEMO1 family protein